MPNIWSHSLGIRICSQRIELGMGIPGIRAETASVVCHLDDLRVLRRCVASI